MLSACNYFSCRFENTWPQSSLPPDHYCTPLRTGCLYWPSARLISIDCIPWNRQRETQRQMKRMSFYPVSLHTYLHLFPPEIKVQTVRSLNNICIVCTTGSRTERACNNLCYNPANVRSITATQKVYWVQIFQGKSGCLLEQKVEGWGEYKWSEERKEEDAGESGVHKKKVPGGNTALFHPSSPFVLKLWLLVVFFYFFPHFTILLVEEKIIDVLVQIRGKKKE